MRGTSTSLFGLLVSVEEKNVFMRLAPGDIVVQLDAYDSVGNALDVLEISDLVFMFKNFFFLRR
jgi:hypothetical protein